MRKSRNLLREINSLERSAQKRRSWSQKLESTKDGEYDSGFVSGKAARQMKRALAIERRTDDLISEKKQLLQNAEAAASLKIRSDRSGNQVLITLTEASARIDDTTILDRISLRICNGDRLAVVGDNGSGKTTLLRLISGELNPSEGHAHTAPKTQIGRSYQIPLWTCGSLRDHLRSARIDETDFRNIMAALNVRGEMFERPLQTFSLGELKKVDLCRSFLRPNHILIWDEPMNYIDLISREQIEEVILAYEPTMVFVEHDRRFIERVATDVLRLE